jgi:hypothetical protein
MMKRSLWQLGLAAVCGMLTLFGSAVPVSAADENPGGPGDRLERLERRVNEMAQRQEQFMRRLGAQQERQAPMAAAGREDLRQMKPLRDRAGIGRPMPPVGAPGMAAAPAPGGPPPAAAKLHKDIGGLIGLCLLIGFVFNILLAIWIFTDIRKRGEGSGLFIALALLAGIPAAIIYSLVRIGDKKA